MSVYNIVDNSTGKIAVYNVPMFQMREIQALYPAGRYSYQVIKTKHIA
jgi:hypothetical protein